MFSTYPMEESYAGVSFGAASFLAGFDS